MKTPSCTSRAPKRYLWNLWSLSDAVTALLLTKGSASSPGEPRSIRDGSLIKYSLYTSRLSTKCGGGLRFARMLCASAETEWICRLRLLPDVLTVHQRAIVQIASTLSRGDATSDWHQWVQGSQPLRRGAGDLRKSSAKQLINK